MKPMLAATLENLSDIRYPIYASVKLDGIRCIIKDGVAVSRAFKPIPNKFIQAVLKEEAVEGLDGELMIEGKDFNEIQSAVMSEDGEPDFQFHVFDVVREAPFSVRYNFLTSNYNGTPRPHIKVVNQELFGYPSDVINFEKYAVDTGYEGIMLRTHDSPYKFGRSTPKERYLMKFKRFQDAEAVVIGFEELNHNDNEKTKDALGHSVRSGHLAGLRKGGCLGSLVVYDEKLNIEFNIGTGFTQEQREEIWDNQKKLMGATVTYVYQQVSAKGVPRFPSFKGFRADGC